MAIPPRRRSSRAAPSSATGTPGEQTPATLSLFGPSGGDDLADQLDAAFRDWVASEPARGPGPQGALRDESAQIYSDMWRAFVLYCTPLEEGGPQRVIRLDPLQDLNRSALLDFLDHGATRPLRQIRTGQAELSVRYAWRLLQLIDRVVNHAREQRGQAPLDAARALMGEAPYRYANATAQTPVPDVLSQEQAETLIAHVTAVEDIDPVAGITWKLLRDRCAVALMLGAGLAPGQVRVLTLDDVSFDADGTPWRLRVAADGSCAEHHTPIASWAARQLRLWLRVRARLGGEADRSAWVFPSTAAGKPWSHPAYHRSAVAVMAAVGIDGGAPFRLRHTFAVRQLHSGHSEEEVARWMGYADIGPMRRYRHVLTAPESGVV
jgi:integrase